jgi:ABC-type transport system substrate-binding protein
MSKKLWSGLSLLVLLSMVLAACATPTPQTIEVTRIVEGEPQTVEVTVEVPVEVPVEAPTGPIAADGLVDCMPLPEAPAAGAGGAALAQTSYTAPSFASKAASVPARPAQQGETTYRVGVFSDITTLNYWAGNGPDNTVYNSYMLPSRPAMYGLADKRFDFVPGLALDLPGPLTQEGDFWVVEVPMRDDVTWSDGTPVTANDAAFTAATVLKFGIIGGGWGNWYDANYLDHIEAVDDFTVKYVYHTKPGLARHEWGTLVAPILPAHFWQPLVDEAAAPIDALGANPSEEALAAAQTEAQDNLYAIDPTGEPVGGAFDVSRWEPGAFIESPAVDSFYDTGTVVTEYANGAYGEVRASGDSLTLYGDASGDAELTFTVGPFVDSTVYSIYGSQDAALLALQAGEVDALLNPLGLQRGLADRVRTDPNLTVLENPTNGFRYLSFNTRRQPMNNCAFRQAVAVLIDKEFVTGTILQGVAFPLYSYVPESNGAWYFDDVPKLGQGLDRGQRTEFAKAILKQAGFSWDGEEPVWDPDNRQVTPGGALLLPDGTPVPPLNIVAPSAGYDPLRSTFAIWIESWLNEMGIPAKAELAGFNVIVPIIFSEQNFDMYILGWSLGLFPDYLRDFFHSEQAVLDGNNAGGYSNPRFDELSTNILTCETNESCKEIANEIQTILATETPYVLLFDTGIIEPYRSASVEFPYTTHLSGLQYAHQGGVLQSKVTVR